MIIFHVIDRVETEIIKSLISSYYDIVKVRVVQYSIVQYSTEQYDTTSSTTLHQSSLLPTTLHCPPNFTLIYSYTTLTSLHFTSLPFTSSLLYTEKLYGPCAKSCNALSC